MLEDFIRLSDDDLELVKGKFPDLKLSKLAT